MSLPPIRREVLVAADPQTAFALFTAHIGAWWPVQSFGVLDGSVAFEGDRLVERHGTEHDVWAEVTSWEPGERLGLQWHPGHPGGPRTVVDVSFAADGDKTLVTLVHSGWEAVGDPQAAHEEYDQGWPVVLGRYEASVSGAGGGYRWFVLTHTPGPALAEGTSVFTHPDFGEHAAFLDRLAERGVLVAAGPIPGLPGAGMTVVRIGADDDLDIAALAAEDDQSVVRGLFEASVEEWEVRFTGS